MQARPANMPAAAQALAALADDIWHAAGDTSADYNWCGRTLSAAWSIRAHSQLPCPNRKLSFLDGQEAV